MISEKIKSEWENEGWTYAKTELGFNFSINFPFMDLKRTITIFFEIENDRKYYYVRTVLSNGTTQMEETLFLEMKEHILIHKTLLDLKWIEEENSNEKTEQEKELTIFNFI